MFHAYIMPSALSVVSGGMLSFTAVPVQDIGPFTYDWSFGSILAPATPTMATGPAASVTFTSTNGWSSDITLHAVDTATGDEWSQHIQVFVSTSAVGGLAPVIVAPASVPLVIGQGGIAEITASGTGVSTWAVQPGSLSTNVVSTGNINGWHLSFPWVGAYTGTMSAARSPLTDTGMVSAAFTVTAEQPGTLQTGQRIGPLQGLIANAASAVVKARV